VIQKLCLLLFVFGAGALFGLTVTRDRSSPLETEVWIELTGAGWPFDQAKAKNLDAVSPPQHAVPAPAGAGYAHAHGSRAGETDRLSAREIARRALSFSVFVRGGPVYGAGIVLDRQGHILTADHVIDGVPEIRVYFHDDPTAFPAKVIERDKKLDLALLAIDKSPEAIAPRGTILDLEMGDDLYAMGAPRKMAFSLSHGIVSYVGRSFDGMMHVQSDLPANSGSSGGPVMNDRGELIGVSSFILRGSQGLAFAVPIDYALMRFAPALGVKAADSDAFQSWLVARQAPAAEGAHPSTTDGSAPHPASGKAVADR
jgi:S1-C subfamily serine protease